MEIKLKAPAKINLSLDVRGKRPDGYHELSTVMQTVRSVYSLDRGEKAGDRDYAWKRDHVSVTLTWTKRYTLLELVWDGTEEEASEAPAEAE